MTAPRHSLLLSLFGPQGKNRDQELRLGALRAAPPQTVEAVLPPTPRSTTLDAPGFLDTPPTHPKQVRSSSISPVGIWKVALWHSPKLCFEGQALLFTSLVVGSLLCRASRRLVRTGTVSVCLYPSAFTVLHAWWVSGPAGWMDRGMDRHTDGWRDDGWMGGCWVSGWVVGWVVRRMVGWMVGWMRRKMVG